MLRALIDWDYGASGISFIRSASDDVDSNGASFVSRKNTSHAGPWSQLLSQALVRDLQEWNDHGDNLDRSPAHADSVNAERLRFYESARRLAVRTQSELGASWQVLWVQDGAWHFVLPPGQFHENGDG